MGDVNLKNYSLAIATKENKRKNCLLMHFGFKAFPLAKESV
jgi:hypothetical protein